MFQGGPAHPLPRGGRLNILFLLPGVALVGLAVLDALWTTLWVDGGAGPVTSRLSTWSWRAMLAVVGRRRHRVLSLFGPIIVVLVVFVWIAMLWGGWVLVFASGEGSLLSTRDYRTPASPAARIYFVGYILTTMGHGDYAPNGPGWELATSLATLNGLLLLTLVISYILSLLTAVVATRAFASRVAGLGGSPEEILLHAWNGRDFHALDLPLSSLSTELASLTEQNLSYPVLQYFHPATPEKAASLALARLDEVLTVLRFGVPEEVRPNPLLLRSSREGIRSFLDMASAYTSPARDAPPPPDLGRLREAGIPTLEDAAFAALAEVAERRKKLRGLLHQNAWSWDER